MVSFRSSPIGLYSKGVNPSRCFGATAITFLALPTRSIPTYPLFPCKTHNVECMKLPISRKMTPNMEIRTQIVGHGAKFLFNCGGLLTRMRILGSIILELGEHYSEML